MLNILQEIRKKYTLIRQTYSKCSLLTKLVYYSEVFILALFFHIFALNYFTPLLFLLTKYSLHLGLVFTWALFFSVAFLFIFTLSLAITTLNIFLIKKVKVADEDGDIWIPNQQLLNPDFIFLTNIGLLIISILNNSIAHFLVSLDLLIIIYLIKTKWMPTAELKETTRIVFQSFKKENAITKRTPQRLFLFIHQYAIISRRELPQEIKAYEKTVTMGWNKFSTTDKKNVISNITQKTKKILTNLDNIPLDELKKMFIPQKPVSLVEKQTSKIEKFLYDLYHSAYDIVIKIAVAIAIYFLLYILGQLFPGTEIARVAEVIQRATLSLKS